ncbi:MAG: hypothetical protein ABI376_11625 [Caulobacteraceae bacterium]
MSVPAADLASPALYPLRSDGGRVTFVEMSEADYAAAAFLDERLMLAGRATREAPWAEVERVAAALGGECDFIFHIGHVGSTLLSRLLGMEPRVFSVREPAILRTLAAEAPSPERDRRIDRFLELWARVWRPEQKTLLKATSFVGEIAPVLMERSPTARALLMVTAPHIHIAGILGGHASRGEMAALAPARLARLNARLGGGAFALEAMSQGERAAMGWTSEIMALAAAANAFPGRVMWLNFERFLERPEPTLAAALGHLHGAADPAGVTAMARSPHMGRYAKAPEHAFDAAARAGVLGEARREHGGEIDRGIAWINAAATAHPAIAAAIRRAAGR